MTNTVDKAKRRFGAVRLLKDIPAVKIIDSTSILVALKLAPHLKMDSERVGIKVSTLFNGEYPEKINIVKGKVNDRKCYQYSNIFCTYLIHVGISMLPNNHC